MAQPVRLQLSRRRGFVLQALSQAANGLPAVNVARPSRFGNRFMVMPCWHHEGIPSIGRGAFKAATAEEAHDEGQFIAVHLFQTIQAPTLDLAPLRGKNLACWCKPGTPCHADVLLELANRPICEAVD